MLINVSKTNKLSKHKHNTKKTCLASIYLLQVYNENGSVNKFKSNNKKKQNLKLKSGDHFVRSIYKSHYSCFVRSLQ